MANNPFEKNSAIALQLATDATSQIKSQISSFGNMSGALAQSSKGIQGDVTRAVSQMTQSSDSAISIAASMSNKLELSGVADKVKANFMSQNLAPSIMYKTNIASYIPKNPVNISDFNKRLPDMMKKMPIEEMKAKQEELLGALDYNYGGLYFPSDIMSDEYAHTYMMLSFKRYARSDPFVPGSLENGANISLPIPDNYTESFNVDYEQRDIEGIGSVEESMQEGNLREDARSLLIERGSFREMLKNPKQLN